MEERGRVKDRSQRISGSPEKRSQSAPLMGTAVPGSSSDSKLKKIKKGNLASSDKSKSRKNSVT